MKPLAVLIIHGVEIQDESFHLTPKRLLQKFFAQHFKGQPNAPDPERAIVVEPVHWAPVLEGAERRLFEEHFVDKKGGFFEELRGLIKRINGGSELWLGPLMALLTRRKDSRLGRLHYPGARWLMMHFVGDAIAYQPGIGQSEVYDKIHACVTEALARLRQRAGDDAPLCVIAHSLGTIIASNYFYDLQVARAEMQKQGQSATRPLESHVDPMKRSPLERGETLAHLYTMGSPLALWSLRYPNQKELDSPVCVPAEELLLHHSGVEGEWVNYYDEDDLIAYPLQPLGDEYRKRVRDVNVRLSGLLFGWTPMVHPFYWANDKVMEPIAKALARTWTQVNGASGGRKRGQTGT
ncbi:hypothetical protein [Vitiosangium sp. GDMCC 1.1324]|uniref:hypothetical protein n=1 Tax=Vitiosangium sp. (strain GDMCC 1.1324) TaxID=2138576 RepID=UPI000D38E021|nr:hypothetical protein [Vitiosangium sp. GDMCC 1.1324]PTL85595.1 hypothetical protein DAT35_02455 [Vitiosangium sp. GDMCC 1.1324]